MLPNRRQAATSLFAAGAAALPFSQALAQIRTDGATSADETPTQIDTGHDAYEHMLGPVTINGQGPFNSSSTRAPTPRRLAGPRRSP